jgi:hypothetical protein
MPWANSRGSILSFLFLGIIVAPGCRESQTTVWQLGCYLFFVYALLMVIAVLLPKVHRLAYFQELVVKFKEPLWCGALGVLMGGILTTYVGFRGWLNLIDADRLVLLFTCPVFIGGVNLILWLRASSPEEKTLRLKVVLVSVSTGLGLLFFIAGALGLAA